MNATSGLLDGGRDAAGRDRFWYAPAGSTRQIENQVLSVVSKRPKIEDLKGDCIDILDLLDQGLLDGHHRSLAGGIKWPRLAKVDIDQRGIAIKFRNGMRQALAIVWQCLFHRGNRYRPWIRCPRCGSNRQALFNSLGGYVCRKCVNAIYKCQVVSTRGRQKARLDTWVRRAGAEYWYEGMTIYKPRLMWRRTFRTIRNAAQKLEAQIQRRRNVRGSIWRIGS